MLTMGVRGKIIHFGGFILVFILILSINQSQGGLDRQINADAELSIQPQKEDEKSILDQFNDSEYMDPFYEFEYMNSNDYVAEKSSKPVDFEIRKNYIAHDVIDINSNDDFEALGFPGSGTEADPYIIEGYIIEGSESTNSISISDITSYFEIRNNYISSVGNGIALTHTTNGLIYNNTVIAASVGIYLDFSSNNTITSNIIVNSTLAGIYLLFSPLNTIKNNIFENGGLRLYGESINDIVQNKVENNTVNGYSLIFIQHVNNYVIDGDVGQIILVNSTYILIENTNITNTSSAIQIFGSSFITISLNTITYSFIGISLYHSSNNTISSNTITNSSIGIYLFKSFKNSISSNIVVNNDRIGIYLSHSSNNIISSNIISYNTMDGFRMYDSANNTLSSNTITNNFGDGISLFVFEPLSFGPPVPYSYNNTIISNIIANNGGAGIEFNYSRDNYIISNTITNNSGNGIEFKRSSGNTITSNIITNNSGNGIEIGYSSDNSITSNIFSDNSDYGIYINGESYFTGHIIKYNNFIDNNLSGNSQAYDKSSLEHFKFNYWSDQTSPDIDDDGLVDNPYAIDGNNANFDIYPLTIPVGEVVLSPYIDNPNDVFYKEGSSNNKIIWNVGGENPGEYYVTFNGDMFTKPTLWVQGSIELDVDELLPGVYTIIVFVYNIYGNQVSDTVIVTVTEVLTSTTSTITTNTGSAHLTNPGNTDSSTTLDQSPFPFVLLFPALIIQYFRRKININRTIRLKVA